MGARSIALCLAVGLAASCDGTCGEPDATVSRTPARERDHERERASAEAPREARAPAVGRWRPLATEGAPQGRDRFAAGLVGRRLVVWGGHAVDGQFQTFLNSGAALDPRDGTWSAIATEGAPAARMAHLVVGLDAALLVWGGRDGMAPLLTGAVYDLDAGLWRATPADAAPPPASDASGVFTGAVAIVWGGMAEDGVYRATGGVYDPRTGTWRPTTTLNAPRARAGHTAVWTGERMIVWGGIGFDGRARRRRRVRPRDGHMDAARERRRPVSAPPSHGGMDGRGDDCARRRRGR